MNWKRSTLIGMLGLATIAYSERSGISAFTAWMDAGFWAKKAEDAAISAAKGTELVDQAVVFHTGLEHLPASFRNTEPDGALRADSEGNLVIDRSVRRLFDYFLAGYGEESSAVLEARIRAYIRSHLTEPARSQANLLLDDYLALQAQLARLDNSSDRPEMDIASFSASIER
ncbi:MAG TPA: hypothetical protein VFM46_04160, partial [Pseudomonadales bacterium]|nr:hypothetical protein [Pseudomonadales bacterium]